MDLLRWLGRDYMPGVASDLRWAWVTLALSFVVVVGYLAIAFNRYFQSKLGRSAESRAAAIRLRNIVLCCCVCGFVFFISEMPWVTWRLYDLALLAVGVYTWSFVLRMRGMSLVDARLAQVNEAERLAEEQRALAVEKDKQAQQKAFFLNALSHDLRAPLNIVALNAHLLKTAAREQADVESAKLIIENAVAAGNLVAKALELAKADAHDRNDTDTVPLPDLLHQVVRRFAPLASEKGLYLRVTGTTDIEVMTDRQKLDRVISNLVDNAIKFTDRGGVTIEIDAGEELVAVRVSDTGIGVPEQSTPYVFNEFYQASGDDAGSRNGFGMGLAICRLLARQLGGDVCLLRTGRDGSCFELTFPGRSGSSLLADRENALSRSDPAASGLLTRRSG